MRLTARGRIVLLLALACLVGYFYLSWAWLSLRNLVRQVRYGFIICSGDWRDAGPGCSQGAGGRISSVNPVVAALVLAGVSLLLVLLGWLLARWLLRPVRTMSDTVGRLGPASLGLRLRAGGPRDEVRQLSDAIDAMLDRVTEGYEAQRRFAANASHELRTPLATQRALIEVSLAGGDLDRGQLDLLTRQLLATNERNENLIEGLLVLAETERGLVSSGALRFDEVVAETAELLGPAARQGGVAVTTELAPVTVAGEAPLLERLAVNLVSNAIKYNRPGGWVRVGVTSPGRLVVANSGPVVPPEQVGALFEPFRRAGGDRLDHGGGVGLGLTIVRSIVAAHHGGIQARANPDGGLTLEVQLPPAG
jgi:signal transduction histidine kinase